MGKVSNSVRPHRLVHLSKTKFNSTKKAPFAHFPNTFILKRLFCIVLLTTVYYVINKMMNLFLDIQFKSSVTIINAILTNRDWILDPLYNYGHKILYNIVTISLFLAKTVFGNTVKSDMLPSKLLHAYLDKILLIVEKTWLWCKKLWSCGLNFMHQHVIAICCNDEPTGRSNIRSLTVCKRPWKVDGKGWMASPKTRKKVK